MNFLIEGKIVGGKKYGRKIGYPTANMDGRATLRTRKIKTGIYAGLVKRLRTGKTHKAAIIVQPIANRLRPQIEAYLINFKGSLYGEKLQFEFKIFIRPYRKFSAQKELVLQIKKDLKKILNVLS